MTTSHIHPYTTFAPSIWGYTHWKFSIDMENDPFIDDLPDIVMFYSAMSNYQRVMEHMGNFTIQCYMTG
jgi:hypothetical protein